MASASKCMHKPGTPNTIFKSLIPWHCCIYYEEYVATPLINSFMEVAGSVTKLKEGCFGPRTIYEAKFSVGSYHSVVLERSS